MTHHSHLAAEAAARPRELSAVSGVCLCSVTCWHSVDGLRSFLDSLELNSVLILQIAPLSFQQSMMKLQLLTEPFSTQITETRLHVRTQRAAAGARRKWPHPSLPVQRWHWLIDLSRSYVRHLICKNEHLLRSDPPLRRVRMKFVVQERCDAYSSDIICDCWLQMQPTWSVSSSIKLQIISSLVDRLFSQ